MLEAATGGALLEILFLSISQYLQQNTCVGFCCEYCEIFEEHITTPILKNISEQVLLIMAIRLIFFGRFAILSNWNQLF